MSGKKKAWVKITIYEPKDVGDYAYEKVHIEGDCEICNQFPCKHTEKYWNFEWPKKEVNRSE